MCANCTKITSERVGPICNLFYDFTTIDGTETRKPNTHVGIKISEKNFLPGPLAQTF